jgi:hypothetical protein
VASSKFQSLPWNPRLVGGTDSLEQAEIACRLAFSDSEIFATLSIDFHQGRTGNLPLLSTTIIESGALKITLTANKKQPKRLLKYPGIHP